jgi:hypothetical protein
MKEGQDELQQTVAEVKEATNISDTPAAKTEAPAETTTQAASEAPAETTTEAPAEAPAEAATQAEVESVDAGPEAPKAE